MVVSLRGRLLRCSGCPGPRPSSWGWLGLVRGAPPRGRGWPLAAGVVLVSAVAGGGASRLPGTSAQYRLGLAALDRGSIVGMVEDAEQAATQAEYDAAPEVRDLLARAQQSLTVHRSRGRREVRPTLVSRDDLAAVVTDASAGIDPVQFRVDLDSVATPYLDEDTSGHA